MQARPLRGLVYERYGIRPCRQIRRGVKAFDKALEIKPDYVKALHNKGNVLDHTGTLKQQWKRTTVFWPYSPTPSRSGITKGLTLAKLPERRKKPLPHITRRLPLTLPIMRQGSIRAIALYDCANIKKRWMRATRLSRLNPQNMPLGRTRASSLPTSENTRTPSPHSKSHRAKAGFVRRVEREGTRP